MKPLNHEEFIRKAIIKHNNKYDYSATIYSNSRKIIIIICPIHGKFERLAGRHLEGAGCPQCNKNNKHTNATFIEKANRIHNNKYDYTAANIINVRSKIKIICREHGVFEQLVINHLQGAGCPRCPGFVTTQEDFITKANKIHNNKYDYSEVDYKKSSNKVKIICPNHGDFLQRPNSHLVGDGCPRCKIRISRPEKEWLDSFAIPEHYRQFKINNFIVDGFNPSTKTVYEFYGDFWHGNPKKYNPNDINPVVGKTFGELYQKTKEKEEKLKESFNVVTVWESDYSQTVSTLEKRANSNQTFIRPTQIRNPTGIRNSNG
jgi:hypothetical protein